MKNIKKILLITIIVILQYTLAETQSRAETIVYHDDFESNQIGFAPLGWTVQRNYQWGNYSRKCMNGENEAEWRVVEIDGSKKLQISIDGPSCVTDIVPDNFTIPDTSNYQFDLDISFPYSVQKDRNVAFRFLQADRWYGIKIIHPNVIEFEKINLAGYSHFGNAYYSKGFTANNTYHFTFRVINNNIHLLINNELIHQVIDQNPILESGSISLKGSIGTLGATTTYFDNIVVTDLSNKRTLLNVPFFSQLDQKWAETTYDSANNWALVGNRGIKDWGCAMTSAAMILNYHGITKDATGAATTPQSLNQYLKENDGYSQKGHLNWPSIAEYALKSIKSGQLTAEARPFDFMYENFTAEKTINDLSLEWPSVIRIVTNQNSTDTSADDDTHFVVAKGYDTLNNIYISDPLLLVDDNPSLTQAYSGKQYSRLGRFTTYLDLNYLWIYVHNDKNYAWIEQHVNKLGTKDGIEYREIENGDYFLEKPSGGEAKLAEASWLFSIPKPTSSEYTLNITSHTPTFTPVEIIAYGNNATHKKLIKNIFVSPTSSRIISIGYNRENVNNLTISLKSSYLTLREGVKFAQSRNWLHHSLGKHFLNLIDLSEKFSYKRKHTSQILLGVIDQQLDMAYKMRKISKLGYELIKGELQSLIEHK